MMMYSPETLDDDTSRGKWIDGACLFLVVVYTDLKHQAYVCGIARRGLTCTAYPAHYGNLELFCQLDAVVQDRRFVGGRLERCANAATGWVSSGTI